MVTASGLLSFLVVVLIACVVLYAIQILGARFGAPADLLKLVMLVFGVLFLIAALYSLFGTPFLVLR